MISNITPLTLSDQVFLLLDRAKTPMNCGGICHFAAPNPNYCRDLAQAWQHSALLPVYPFNQVLKNRFFWQTAVEFDPKNHLFYHSFKQDETQSPKNPTDPTSDNFARAIDFIAEQHTKLLPKNQPLWTMHLLDLGTTFIAYIKIHHALADGVAALRLVEKILRHPLMNGAHTGAFDANLNALNINVLDNSALNNANCAPGCNEIAHFPPPFWAIPTRGVLSQTAAQSTPQAAFKMQEKSAKTVELSHKNILKRLLPTHTQQIIPSTITNYHYYAQQPPPDACSHNTITSKNTSTRTFTNIASALWHNKSTFLSLFNAPKTPFNDKISNKRAIFTLSLPKSALKKIATAKNATTNELLLAIFSGALHHYLTQKNALPNRALTGFVPISLRKDDSANGNQLAFLLADLATSSMDKHARLNAIQSSLAAEKARFLPLSAAEIVGYSAMRYGLFGINLAGGLFPKKQAFNVVLSSISSREPLLQLGGAPLLNLYPASVLLDGQGLNITLCNRPNTVDICLIVCPRLVPDGARVIKLINKEWQAWQK